MKKSSLIMVSFVGLAWLLGMRVWAVSGTAVPQLTATPSPTSLPCDTPIPTGTPSITPTFTGTPTPTHTPTPTDTPTPGSTPTNSPTATPCVSTPTPTPTFDNCWTPTPIPTNTPPPGSTPTFTPTAYNTPTPAPTVCIPTPTGTLTPGPTETPVFSATVHVTTSATAVLVGEVVSVTTDLTIAPGCVYPVYELTLTQEGDDAPIFTPESVVVGPGVPMPHTIAVTAVTTGTITFDVQLYGERNCGNGWQWHYLYGESANVTVQAIPSGNLPDLIISDITYNGGTPQCGTHPPDLGARVWVQNVGNALAGSFVIDVNNGTQQTVDGLAVGEETSLVFGGVLGSVTAVADATDLIEESDESNNSFSTILPNPTQPPPCTPTPAPAYYHYLPITIK